MKSFLFVIVLGFLVSCSAGNVKEESNSDRLPLTLEAAVEQIISDLSEADRMTVKQTSFYDLILYHHGWGTGIRNSFGLWRGNESLLESACGDPKCHPDDASMKIIQGVWNKLNDKPIRFQPKNEGDIELFKKVAEEAKEKEP